MHNHATFGQIFYQVASSEVAAVYPGNCMLYTRKPSLEGAPTTFAQHREHISDAV